MEFFLIPSEQANEAEYKGLLPDEFSSGIAFTVDPARFALVCGLAAIIAGCCLLVYAFAYPISVASGDGLYQIVNAGLTSDRLVLAVTGGAVFLGGVFGAAASWLILTVQRLAAQHSPAGLEIANG